MHILGPPPEAHNASRSELEPFCIVRFNSDISRWSRSLSDDDDDDDDPMINDFSRSLRSLGTFEDDLMALVRD